MPSRQQLESALIGADKAGDVQAATLLANALKSGQYDDVPRGTLQATAGQQVSPAPDVPPIPGGQWMAQDDPNAPPDMYPGAVGQPLPAENDYPMQDIIEPALTVATGAIAEPVAGAVALSNAPFVGMDNAADMVESIRKAMTFVPRGDKSLETLQWMADKLEPVSNAMTAAEDLSGDTGAAFSPALGAISKAVPAAALEALGLGAVRRGLKAAKQQRNVSAPVKEITDNLERAGIRVEDLSPETQSFIKNKGEIETASRFEQIDAPYLKGQVTKDLEQRKIEQGLMESVTDSTAEPIRQTMLRQSEAIKGELQNIAGDAPQFPSTKEALTKRKKDLKAIRRENYDILSENAKSYEGFDLSPDAITEALPDRGTLKDMYGIRPNEMKTLDGLLNDFGMIDPSDIDGFLKSGGDIEPLSLGNFERFRKRLNAIESSDQTGNMSRVIGPIKRALDEEIDVATRSLEGVGGEIGEAAKNARQAHINLKTEFDPAKMTSKLIDSVKRGSDKAKIESSQVMDRIMAKNTPIEEIDRVMESLRKAGPDGKRAIQEMQGRAVLDLLDSAFSAQSRQVSGQRVFGATPFSKQFEKLEPKLKSLFKNDKAGYKRLENIYKVAQDIVPPNAAVPKGSAGFFIDVLNKIGVYSLAAKVPFARESLELLKKAGESAGSRKRVEKALDSNPSKKKKFIDFSNMVNRDFPQLATVIGISSFLQNNENLSNKTKSAANAKGGE